MNKVVINISHHTVELLFKGVEIHWFLDSYYNLPQLIAYW